MNSFTNIKAVLFTGKKYADGTSPILIRITNQRKSNYVKTGYSVLPENWNALECAVYESKPRMTAKLHEQLSHEAYILLAKQYKQAVVLPNGKKINADISDQINDLKNIKRKLEVNEEKVSSAILKDKLNKKALPNETSDIFTYSEKIVGNLRDMDKIGTHKRYKTILARLKEFHPKALPFKSITHTFLNDYEVHLVKQGYKTNYIHNHLKTIKALYRQAINDGIASQADNPFYTYKLKVDYNIRKDKLSENELNLIKVKQFEKGTTLWHTRNYFLFSYYMAGIRVSDLMQLKWKNVRDGRIEYNMDKTGGYKSIRIHKELATILLQYEVQNPAPENYILPILSNTEDYSNTFYLKAQISSKTTIYNKNLKKLAEQCGVNKHLTTHIARHTFADIARKKGAAVYDVSKALGHSSIRITENYLSKFDVDSLDNTLDTIFK